MCHSPSGALSVQAPDRACWASADIATASDKPAASPPDTTFCAKLFITDLREKGDSPTLRQLLRCCGTDIGKEDCREDLAVVAGDLERPRMHAAYVFIVVWGRQGAHPEKTRIAPARGRVDLDGIVRISGNNSISSLSDFAAPHGMSIMIYTRAGWKLPPMSSPVPLPKEERLAPPDRLNPADPVTWPVTGG
jgi:hypothetical protein